MLPTALLYIFNVVQTSSCCNTAIATAVFSWLVVLQQQPSDARFGCCLTKVYLKTHLLQVP